MKKRTLFLFFALLLILSGSILLLLRPDKKSSARMNVPAPESFVRSTPKPVPKPSANPAEAAPIQTAEPYVSPIDFEALWEYNTDIYAWLEIPGTDISQPIVQNAEDDSFYLRRSWYGEYSSDGAFFTESEYNDNRFSDPVTVIYGHNMKDGDMFGRLRSLYSEENCLEDYGEILVYLPDRELHFDVFAALPYDDRHILYNYDFSDDWIKNHFFYELSRTRSLSAVIDPDYYPGGEGQYIILSTCTYTDGSRFLVIGQCPDILAR